MSLESLLTPFTLTVGLIAGCLIGVAKTGVPGVGTFASLLMISAFRGHEMFASGAVVPLLILGDVTALLFYRKNCDFKLLARLLPPVVVGLLLGAGALCVMHNSQFTLTVGILATSIIIFEFLRKRFGWTQISTSFSFRLGCGILAGLTTMLGNAAGAVSAAYLSSQNLNKKNFMGTNSVLFFIINVAKIPLMLVATGIKSNLGFDTNDAQLMNATTFMLTLIFAPALIAGGFIGRRLYNAIPEKVFVPFILFLNLLTAIYILTTAILLK